METRGQENFSTTMVNVNDDSADDDHVLGHIDYSRGTDILRWIVVGGIFPVCVLGLAGNAVSVWVWNADREHNTLVLLFQCLGVADILYLLAITAAWALYLTEQLSPQSLIAFICVQFFFQSLSVHTTLTIGVFRCLGVARPQRVRQMTRRHVIMTCSGLGAWSGVLTVLLIVKETTFTVWSTEEVVMQMALEFIGLILPILVLLGFSIALLVTFHQQGRQVGRKHRGVTIAVLCIAGCTCLAYPMATGANVILVLQRAGIVQDTLCNGFCYYALLGVRFFLQAINSCVNFVIYYFFASKFRQVLRRNLGQLLNTVRNMFRAASAAQSISDEVSEESAEDPPPGLPEERPQTLSREEKDLAEATTSV